MRERLYFIAIAITFTSSMAFSMHDLKSMQGKNVRCVLNDIDDDDRFYYDEDDASEYDDSNDEYVPSEYDHGDPKIHGINGGNTNADREAQPTRKIRTAQDFQKYSSAHLSVTHEEPNYRYRKPKAKHPSRYQKHKQAKADEKYRRYEHNVYSIDSEEEENAACDDDGEENKLAAQESQSEAEAPQKYKVHRKQSLHRHHVKAQADHQDQGHTKNHRRERKEKRVRTFECQDVCRAETFVLALWHVNVCRNLAKYDRCRR